MALFAPMKVSYWDYARSTVTRKSAVEVFAAFHTLTSQLSILEDKMF